MRPLGRVIGRSWKSSGAIKINLAKQKLFKTYLRRAKTPETHFPKDFEEKEEALSEEFWKREL